MIFDATGAPIVSILQGMLDGLLDVVIDDPALGDTLRYDGTTWVNAPLNWSSIIGAPAPANPTALVGLIAVNGVATTYMRSDAAPALNQAIAPTWTGAHTFTTTGVTVNAGTTPNAPSLLVVSNRPIIVLNELDAAVDDAKWYIDASTEQFRIATMNGAGSNSTSFFIVDRTGIAVDSVTFPSAVIFTKSGDGANLGSIQITSAIPQWNLYETDAAVDSKSWSFSANGAQLRFRTSNDANTVVGDWLLVNRTGTVIDKIEFKSTLLWWNGAPIGGSIDLTANYAWTGLHSFTSAGPAQVIIQSTGAAAARLDWIATGGPANNKRWLQQATTTNTFDFYVANDASDAYTMWMRATRAANVVSSVAITATALTFNGVAVVTNSGTWAINITGNSATVAGLAVHTARNNVANQIVRTDANGYLPVGYINCLSGNENNASNPPRVWGTNGSDDYMRSYQTAYLSVSYAATAGSAPANGGSATYATYWWSVSHAGTYYQVCNWTGAHWHITSNHGSPCRVGYADVAGSGTGTFVSAAFNANSSRKIKRETGFPKNPQEILAKLRPILYRLLEGETYEQIGLIAEEAFEICPWLSKDGSGVAYDRLALLLLADWQQTRGIDWSQEKAA